MRVMVIHEDLGADIVALDPSGGPLLMVMVRAVQGRSPEWAAEYLHRVFARLPHLHPKYYLIATLDNLYYFEDPSQAASMPTAVLNSVAVLQPYATRINVKLGDLYPSAFESLVTSWIYDMTLGNATAPPQLQDMRRDLTGAPVKLNLAA